MLSWDSWKLRRAHISAALLDGIFVWEVVLFFQVAAKSMDIVLSEWNWLILSIKDTVKGGWELTVFMVEAYVEAKSSTMKITE